MWKAIIWCGTKTFLADQPLWWGAQKSALGYWDERGALASSFCNSRHCLLRGGRIQHLDAPGRKLGSMVRINGLVHLLRHGVYCGYNPFTNLLLTSWDIQAQSGEKGAPQKKQRTVTVYFGKKWLGTGNILDLKWSCFFFTIIVLGCNHENLRYLMRYNFPGYNLQEKSFIGGYSVSLAQETRRVLWKV